MSGLAWSRRSEKKRERERRKRTLNWNRWFSQILDGAVAVLSAQCGDPACVRA